MTPERIQQLLEKYLSNTASAIEEAELTQWYNSTNEHPVEWPVDHQGEPEEIKARMLRKLQAEVHSSSYPQSIPFYRKRSWQIAASVLLLLGAAAWFTLSKPATDPKETAVITATNPDPILPGGNKATLTLGDGSTILLDTAGNTLLAQEGATRIIKLDNGQLAYKDASKENTGSTTSYNTIRTPNGDNTRLFCQMVPMPG
ncbi:hypothetical protein FSB84_02955 [Pseudobacter ginsenosidimutans]|uniref:hypothetical protein n=1 Tax=Pseudobacter ginsenosidimutans TaxID=661488 RepID=UPI0011BB4E3B|nr:hypothetical protein [Pseudobacter ginsenosidimutans]QEC40705.1 hypothetical protein FSB84_02955 [Pseudobacter ginsenosidimutans]